jgi:hypothetical protein
MAYSGAVYSFPQNWADDVIERLSWLTDVMTHRDGSEQRRQPRLYPRRMFEYSVLPQSQVLQTRLENFLWGKSDEAMIVPIWTDAQRLTTAATSGTATVTVNTVTYDYDANGYVILWRSPSSYEVVAIDSVASGGLTLAENIATTWPIGTIVAPARLGRLTQQMQGTQIAHNLRPYKLIFEIDEASYSTNRITALSPTQYLSRDTFEFPTVPTSTEASDDLDFGYDQSYAIIDAQTGAVALDTGARSTPTLLIPYAQKFASRTQISEWWGFLDRRQGRRVPFWMPSWEKDFQPVTITNGVSGAIDYEANGYADWIDAASGRKDIAIIYLAQGQVYAQGHHQRVRITAATNNGDGTETINCPLNFVYEEDKNLIRVSFLRFCRMESDTVEIAWKNTCVAVTKQPFREIYSVP